VGSRRGDAAAHRPRQRRLQRDASAWRQQDSGRRLCKDLATPGLWRRACRLPTTCSRSFSSPAPSATR
jgi:hypothetical protein